MKVLVISVHPDDETLGCGGTLLKHYQKNDELFWLILTGVSKQEGYSDTFIQDRERQILKVSQEYNFSNTINLEYPTRKLHLVDLSDIINKIYEVVQKYKPEIVYTVNRSDIHTDHQIAAKSVMSATKSFRNSCIRRILMYECISETEMSPGFIENAFIPNVFTDISPFLEKKIEIMKLYKSELQISPMPRSIENLKALAKFRGATVSVDYAEAFMLIREIN